jgi:3',5'-cyclic AMP phosphodiesterase CpdA
MRLAHLTDLHFGTRVRGEMLACLTEDVKAQAPDLLVVTGDVTDRGLLSEFRAARAFLESLGIPFLSVPGNREVGVTAFWEWMFPRYAMGRYRRFFGPSDRVLHCCEEARLAFFGLNSVHPFPSWPGSISRDTRYWLKAQADALKDYRKVLFLHHPVMPVIRGSSYWAHSLADAGELLNISSETGIVLILQGHKHRSAVVEVSVPARDARVVVSAAGAPLMPFWDPAYHVIDMLETHMVVQPREFREGRFLENGAYRFDLADKSESVKLVCAGFGT